MNTPIEVMPIRTEVSPHDYQTSADFKLINQLLKNPRYDIPEHLRHKVISSIDGIISNPDNNPKLQLDAIKTLAALDKINTDIVRAVMPKRTEVMPVRAMSEDKLLEEVQRIIRSLPQEVVNG